MSYIEDLTYFAMDESVSGGHLRDELLSPAFVPGAKAWLADGMNAKFLEYTRELELDGHLSSLELEDLIRKNVEQGVSNALRTVVARGFARERMEELGDIGEARNISVVVDDETGKPVFPPQ